MARNIVLTGADGVEWDLLDGPVQAGLDPQLWGSSPVQISERVSAALAGSRVVSRRHQAMDLILPMVFVEPDEARSSTVTGASYDNVFRDETGDPVTDQNGDPITDGVVIVSTPVLTGVASTLSLENLVASFARSVDPIQGDVNMSVARLDGTVRTITATYIGGMSQLALRHAKSTFLESTVAFRAADPFWSNVVPDTVTITPPPPVFTLGTVGFNDADTSFNASIPFNGFEVGTMFNDADVDFNGAGVPFSGDAGGVRIFKITNNGDVEAWPTFNVTGPGTVIEAFNISTGKRWTVNDLDSGAMLHVATKPGAVRVTLDGVNAYGSLTDGSELWPLPRGESTIAIRFDGTDEDVSTFSMFWTPRYLTC